MTFRGRHVVLVLLAALLALVGCKEKLTSPKLTASGVQPDLVCNAQLVTGVAISGSGFTPLPTETLQSQNVLILPTVTLTKKTTVTGGDEAGEPVVLDGDPREQNADNLTWNSSEQMTMRVDEPLALDPGIYDVTVTNPDGKKTADIASALAVVPPPSITDIVPPAICNAQSDQTIMINGEWFLDIGGTLPTVTITSADGSIVEEFTVEMLDGCEAIPGRSPAAQTCTSATITIPEDTLPPGEYSVVLTNPEPANCMSTEAITLIVNPPPTVTSVMPALVCSGGSDVVIEGMDFQQGMTARLECPTSGTTVDSTAVTVSGDGTRADVTFGAGIQPGEDCDVVVENPDRCIDEPPHEQVTGTEGPILFFVDPPVVYNGISTKVTLFVTEITGMADVTIRPADDPMAAETDLDQEQIADKRLQATVPEGQAPGTYDVIVADDSGCRTTLEDGLIVTDMETITLLEVVPPFGQEGTDTPVTIFRDTSAPAPGDDVFDPTPRVFLNPDNPMPGDVAVQVQGVSFVSGDELTAVVPDTAPLGVYDVIVVNPDGAVGVLDQGFEVIADERPEIETVTPQSLTNETGRTLTVTGTGFRGASVSLECTDLMGASIGSPTPSSQPEMCSGGTCTITATVDASSLPRGAICKVIVTNSDGSFAEFSAIGVTNPSLNLESPRGGTSLNTGRRALAAEAVRSTGASRFVYAIGGDEGPGQTPLGDIELASVGVFGGMGDFIVNREMLGTARAFHGSVSIGRYMYVFGGTDGTDALASGERALVLSPLETPAIEDIDLCLAGGSMPCFGVMGTGIPEGEYSYRVSAVIDSADPVNLGGETLASDPISLRLRNIAGRNIVVELSWSAPLDDQGMTLSGITGYRIYRTPADGTAGVDEVLLGEVDAMTFTFVDDGSATLGTETPLPSGSTSAWQAIPDMGAVRSGLSAAVARDPDDPNGWYIYALLGKDSGGETGGTGLTSYEFLDVSVQANGRQTVGTWTAGNGAASQGRWQAGAWAVDSRISTLAAAGETWIYLGGGRLTTGNMLSGVSEVGRLVSGAGGQLTAWDASPDDINPDRAGFGAVPIGVPGFAKLLLFGGLQAAQPRDNAIGAQLLDPLPDISNWNNEGLAMQSPRYLAGTAVESAFIFLIGGQTDGGGSVTGSTEFTVW